MSKVFRIEKNKNYTVMSNYHFRDKNISLKAKGLLSQMLSLPEDWEYSINGLAAINKEGRDGINATLKELEKNGYIVRNQMRTESGAFGNVEYVIYEEPQNVVVDSPCAENPYTVKPIELEYVEKDGLFYPLLSFDSVESEEDLVGVGKYGTLWLEQMRECYPYQYKLMRLGGELRQAALQVNKEMYDCIEQIEEEQFRKHYTSESRGFMEILRLRNQIRMMAEELAIEEIIKCSQKL